MSTHDRGAFGQLLAEAKALGIVHCQWDHDLRKADEDSTRWVVVGFKSQVKPPHDIVHACGRTGEEALRQLVEKLRG